MRRHPPDILITTPESLYLILTSAAREMLAGVETVIVDEIHALAASKRGTHLALSLERLAHLTGGDVQRIGLSATQRPLEEIARFLGGDRPVEIVDAGHRKPLDLEVVVPVDDMRELGGAPAVDGEPRQSIWPAIYPRLLELVRAHRSTLVFVNSRRAAERVAHRLNELAERGHRPRPPRLDRPRAAARDRGDAQDRPAAGAGRHVVARARDRHGRDRPRRAGRVAEVGRRRPAARRPRRPPGGRRELRPLLPQVPRRPARDGGRRRPHARGRDRAHARAPPAARRARPAARRDDGDGRLGGRRPARDGDARRPLPRPQPDPARGRARHAGRPLPVRRVRRAATAGRLGSHGRRRARPRRRPPAGGHHRRHDPRPRPLRRLPGRLGRARRRARRGDGLRGPPGRGVPARRDVVADRADHPRPGARLARARRARADAVLEGRRRRPPVRARPGRRRGGPHAPVRRPRRAGREQPLDLPRRPGGRDRRHPVRPHDRGRALPRRDRRLAGVRALAVRRPRPRAVGAGGRAADGRGARDRGRGDVGRRRHRHPPARLRHAAAGRPDRDPARRPRRPPARPGLREPALRRPLPRERRPRAAPPAPPAGAAHAALAAAPEGARPAAGGEEVRVVPGAARDLPRGALGRLRGAGAEGPSAGDRPAARCGWSRSSRPSRRRSPRRSCSTTSRPTCTRATRPPPSAAHRRSSSTARCSPSSCGPTTCASCSTATRSTRSRASSRARAARLDADRTHDLLRRLGDLSRDELAARGAADVDGLVAAAAGRRGADRGRRAADRRRGRRALPRRARRRPAARASDGVPRAGRRRAPAAGAPLRPHARAVHRRGALRARWGVDASRRPARPGRRGGAARGRVPARRPGTEWVAPDVLRRVRRRTLAAVRRAVEPVEAEALARFLPAWQGIGRDQGRGIDRLRDVVAQLQGIALPVAAWESDVLPIRVPGYTPGDAGRAVRRRRARLDRRRPRPGGPLPARRTPASSGQSRRGARKHIRSSTRCALGERCSSPTSSPPSARASARCWPSSGASSGPAWSRTTPGSRCAAARPCGRSTSCGRAAPAGGRGRPRRSRPRAGRWSLVEGLLQPAPAPARAGPGAGRDAARPPRRA